jgi:hypothetical protein
MSARLFFLIVGLGLTAVVLSLLGGLLFDPSSMKQDAPEGLYAFGAFALLWWLAYFGSRSR